MESQCSRYWRSYKIKLANQNRVIRWQTIQTENILFSDEARFPLHDHHVQFNHTGHYGTVIYSRLSKVNSPGLHHMIDGIVFAWVGTTFYAYYSLDSFNCKILIFIFQGHHGFEDLRRYVKQGSDFCKELAAILYER